MPSVPFLLKRTYVLLCACVFVYSACLFAHISFLFLMLRGLWCASCEICVCLHVCVCSNASRFKFEKVHSERKKQRQLNTVVTLYTVFNTTVECWSSIIWTKADIWQTCWPINIHELKSHGESVPVLRRPVVGPWCTQQDVKAARCAEL